MVKNSAQHRNLLEHRFVQPTTNSKRQFDNFQYSIRIDIYYVWSIKTFPKHDANNGRGKNSPKGFRYVFQYSIGPSNNIPWKKMENVNKGRKVRTSANHDEWARFEQCSIMLYRGLQLLAGAAPDHIYPLITMRNNLIDFSLQSSPLQYANTSNSTNSARHE